MKVKGAFLENVSYGMETICKFGNSFGAREALY